MPQSMIRGHIIELCPNDKQATHLSKACGVARLSYNWALAEWQSQFQADKDYRQDCLKQNINVNKDKLNAPSQGKLRKQLNAIKREQFPFMLEVTKCSPQLAIMQLGDAFKRFFAGQGKYPQFRKKGVDDRFSLSNDQFRVDGKLIKIPNLGWVKMRESLRFNGKILSAKVFRRGGKWFISIAVELTELPAKAMQRMQSTGQSVGIDLGISSLATLSNGEIRPNIKALRNKLAKLRRESKALSRKDKGSANRAKAKTKLGKLHYQISCIRQNLLHQLTTELVTQYDVICIEDLNVKGMMKNRKLARSIADVGFCEFKRQLIYKAIQCGKTVKSVDRFFPSSKTCSVCDEINHNLTLSMRLWTCDTCQTLHNRDVNAAKNILRYADKVLTVA